MEQKVLTPRQREIFEFIKSYFDRYGYAPTYEEIGKAVSLSSTATIFTHIKTLVKKGYIKRQKGVSRGIEILIEEELRATTEVQIPILGYITGVTALEEHENQDAKLSILRKYLEASDLQACFALQVKGSNLVSECLLEGDYIIIEYKDEVKSGDEALVRLDEDITTIRRIVYNEDEVQLESITDPLKLVKTKNLKIQGKIVYVLRVYA